MLCSQEEELNVQNEECGVVSNLTSDIVSGVSHRTLFVFMSLALTAAVL